MAKSTEEILAEARSLSRKALKSTAAPEPATNTSGKKGGWSLKGFISQNIYDLGEEAPVVEVNPETEEHEYADVPEFEVPDTTDDLSKKPLAEIYAEANVPESACDIDEFAQILESPDIAKQPLNFKVMAVPFALKMKGVDISAPLSDAASRDAALDGYQLMLTKRAKQIREESETKIQEINTELERIFAEKQQEIENLKTQAADAERQNLDFVQIRNAEEKRMADLIAPFLGGQANPVTVGNTPTDEGDVALPATTSK